MLILKLLNLRSLLGFLLATALAIPNASGQFSVSQKMEVGWWVGGANYIGDIAASYTNYYKNFRPAGGIYHRMNFDKRVSLRTGMAFSRIVADDALSTNAFEQVRNLSFRSDILDFTAVIEFNFFEYDLDKEFAFSPYLYLGLGVFKFSTQAQLDPSGGWYNLKRLGTEGQLVQNSGRDPYNTTQMQIPIGGGIKMRASSHLTVGFEVGLNKTFSDHLDDVATTYVDSDVLMTGPNGSIAVQFADRSSEVVAENIGSDGGQRGDASRNDTYLHVAMTFAIAIRKIRCFNNF